MIKKVYTLWLIFCFILLSNVVRAQDSVSTKKDSVKSGNNIPNNMADSTKVKENKQLQQFRKLFNKVIEGKKGKQRKKEKKDPILDIGGLILDETRSKMGRDFYSLFYQNWKAPKNASNFTITISERPSHGLGSLVSIKVDYDQVFKARLQPRYAYIKAVSKQAVRRCQHVVQKQASVRKQLSGF